MERIGRTRRAGLALCLVTLAVVALGWNHPAAAHTDLVSSDPAAGSTVRSLSRVTLRFSEDVEAAGSHLWLERDGEVLDLGQATHPGGDAKALEAAVPAITSGAYQIGFHVVATDGDPDVGAVPFSLDLPPVPGAPATPETATEPPALARTPPPATSEATSTSHGHGTDLPVGAARVVLDASLATLVGGIAFVASVWPQGASSRATRQLLWGAAVAAAVASFVLATEQHAVAIGIGLGDALTPAHLRTMLDFRFGKVALARIVLLAMAGGLIARLRSFGQRGAGTTALCGIGVAVAFGLFETVVLLGHSGDEGGIEAWARLVHTAGVSVWLGGLVMLVAFVLPRRRREELVAVLPRFSQLATVAVAAVLVAGLVLADGLVGGVRSLVTTEYGRVLLLKVVVVLALLVIARRSRDHVRRKLATSTGTLVRPLTTWIAIELGLIAVVFALTALLVSQQPPA